MSLAGKCRELVDLDDSEYTIIGSLAGKLRELVDTSELRENIASVSRYVGKN